MEENKGITFYRDGVCNYMVLQCPPACGENYQYRMLAANQIHGLLTCSRRSIDNQEYLYYDITSRQSLADLFDRRQVRGTDLEKLLRDLLRMEDILTEYLLDVNRLILDPACIYADFREQEYSFAYYPGEEREADWASLFLFLADRVDGKDKSAAALVYRLCMMAEKPGFRLQIQMLEEPGMEHLRKKAEPSFVRSAGQPGDWNLPEHRLTGSSLERDTYPGAGGTGEILASRADLHMDGNVFKNRNKEAGTGSRLYRSGKEAGSGEAPRQLPGGGKEDGNGTDRRTGRSALPAAIVMAAGGAALLTGGFLLDLDETAVILSRAIGAVVSVCGILLLVVYLVRRRGQRSGQEDGTDKYEYSGPETVPELWGGYEDPADGSFLKEPGWSGFMQADAISGSGGWSDRLGETTLLGADPGRQAALYGLGACRGEQIRLSRLPCVVGKMQDYVDQVLEDASISRMHAKFSTDREGRITVRDLNSTNGTWLNGERLQPNETRILQQGDHLRLGSMEFVFR